MSEDKIMIMSKWRTSKQEHLKHFVRRSTQTSNTGNVTVMTAGCNFVFTSWLQTGEDALETLLGKHFL